MRDDYIEPEFDDSDDNLQARWDREDGKRMNKGYFVREDNSVVFYDDIARAIKALHPNYVGKHIFEQLHVLGLDDAFARGRTPCNLPYSFTQVL